MASKEARERKLKEIREIAEGWGKIIAREAFPEGLGLDVTLADMEEIAAAASQALVKGAVEEMTGEQGKQLGTEAAVPDLPAVMSAAKEIPSGDRARRYGRPGGAGGALPDMSSGFFSLSVRR